MKFLRGIVCYITFIVYVIGFCVYLVSSMAGEDDVKGVGIALLIFGFVLSLIESRFYPKGKRAKCAAFFFVNGAIIFCYMSIVLFPVAKMISTMLEAQHGDFFDWKEGFIWNQSEERLAMKKPSQLFVNRSETGQGFGTSEDDTPEYLRTPGTGDSYRVTTGVWGNDTKYVVDENGNEKVVRKTSYGRYIDDDGNEYM